MIEGFLLSWLPILGLAVSYPRRSRAGVLVLAAALGGSLHLHFLSALPREAAGLFGAWACAATFCGWLLCRKNREDYLKHSEELEVRRRLRLKAAQDLSETRARGQKAEKEQKESLALYGMVKSLAEAVSWEEVRPRLEAAVDHYLGLSEFSFYTACAGKKEFRPLVVRRLEGSPGASWATLERCLQERGLAATAPQALESPESAVAVPILENGEWLGYFYGRAPKGADLRTLMAKAQVFVSEIAFAFRRVRLFQEMEDLSRIDGLTGVFRRGDFDERLSQEIVRARTFKTSLGLLMLDIDHFKRLNDRYGHPFGDQVLRRVGEILNASMYDTDFVARYGGEEFVVLMPRADPQGILRKAESLRRSIESERFQIGFEVVPVTVSLGLAHFPRDASAPDELVARADAALYQAKSQGRNRVIDCQSLRI